MIFGNEMSPGFTCTCQALQLDRPLNAATIVLLILPYMDLETQQIRAHLLAWPCDSGGYVYSPGLAFIL